MKRAFCYLFPILLLFSCFKPMFVLGKVQSVPTDTIEETELYARYAVLMDADSGRVLFGKNAENPAPMASTTKIMTCILTLENADLNDIVKVSAYASKMPEVKLHIMEGESYRLKDLLYSLMLESHNDSAVAIAEHVGGSIEGFAQMMNEKAASIGCTDTFFITPNGLDASTVVTEPDGTKTTKVHSTTATDLARILSYCIKQSPKQEEFLEITRTQNHSFHNLEQSEDKNISYGGRSFSCVNHNAFLHMMDGALTGKTGFTGNAGYCYVGALQSKGRTFVIALLACGWPSNKTYKWKDARKLFQYGIRHYKKTDITNYDYLLNPIPIENGAGKDRLLKTKMQLLPVIKQEEQIMLLSDSDIVKVSAELPQLLQAPVSKGMVLGSLNYYVNGELFSKIPIYASKDIKARSLPWYFRLVVSRYFYPYLT